MFAPTAQRGRKAGQRQKPPTRGGSFNGGSLANDPIGTGAGFALRRLDLQAKLFDHVPADKPANAVVLGACGTEAGTTSGDSEKCEGCPEIFILPSVRPSNPEGSGSKAPEAE